MSNSYTEGFVAPDESVWTCETIDSGDSHSDYTSNEAVSSFGGFASALGIADPLLLNSPDFGVNFSVTAGSSGAVVAVDSVKLRVYYVDDITAGVKEAGRADSFTSVAYGTGNVAIIVGAKGEIYRSTDNGVTWATVESGTVSDLQRVTYTPSGFVAVGDRGTILRSTDEGVTWVGIASGTLSSIRSIITKGANKLIALANDGVTLSSRNYIAWTVKR